MFCSVFANNLLQVSGTLQNYVVVLLNESKSRNLQDAVDQLMAMLQNSKTSFEKAADDLVRKSQHDPKLAEEAKAVIATHRHFVTGLIEWTLTSERYKMGNHMQADGSVEIPLHIKTRC